MAGTVRLVANGAIAESVVKPFHLDEATISDVHAAYRSGALTAARLVQAYQERIQAYDQAGPKLNVVIFLNPKAQEEAAGLDEHFRKTGKFVGPLHGIPVLLKDNVNTKDMPTTGGSLSLAGYMPANDAAITQKLRSAGAIILATVNLHRHRHRQLHPVTRVGEQHCRYPPDARSRQPSWSHPVFVHARRSRPAGSHRFRRNEDAQRARRL